MKRIPYVLLCALACDRAQGGQAPVADVWVTAYHAGWMKDHLPPEDVDVSAVTHLVAFAAVPNDDGTLDTATFELDEDFLTRVATAAHAGGKKALVTIGGPDTQAAFEQAMSEPVRASFIDGIVGLARSHGYDGVDIDMEPIDPADAPDFTAFIRALRAELDAAAPGMLLTAAVIWEPELFRELADSFDQINLMTYEMSGPWEGWETWHNAPLYDGGLRFESTGDPLPSCDGRVREALDAGIPAAKLGIGIDFYGFVWSGATGPNQPIAGVTATEAAYHELMDMYGEGELYDWHEGPEAPYLSIQGADPKFISYDDVRLCGEKVDYVRASGLGGVILWEIGGGYRPGQPAGQRDPLLQAVGAAAFGP